jgi:hypothetical protein
MADADQNIRATSLNYPDLYRVVQRLHGAFLKCAEAVERDNREERVVPRFLLVRAHSSVFAAMRLAMSGQAAEAHPVLRSGIEQVWYGLHIAKDPEPPKRARIWLSRGDDAEATAHNKQEFTVANVRATHEALDAATSKDIQGLYERMIDFGAHPNQVGVLAGLTKTETGGTTTYGVSILRADDVSVVAALQAAVAVGVGALKVFALIYPERFRLTGLDAEIEALVAGLNGAFKQYARATSK